jgi:transposase
MRFDLTDDEWALLEPLMPKSRKSARVDDRKIMNAIFYVLRTGMPWRDLPERYGLYTTAYNRFNRWSRRGVWKQIFDQVAARGRANLGQVHAASERRPQLPCATRCYLGDGLPVTAAMPLASRTFRGKYVGWPGGDLQRARRPVKP